MKKTTYRSRPHPGSRDFTLGFFYLNKNQIDMTNKSTLSVADKISQLTHSAEYRKYMKTINRMMTNCEEKTSIPMYKPKPHTLDYFRADGFGVHTDNSLGYERTIISWSYGKEEK